MPPDIPEPTAPNITRTIDAVEDAGWDPDGREPITMPDLPSGTRLWIPEGKYRWAGSGVAYARRSDIAIDGAGWDKVRIVSAPGQHSGRLLNVNGGRRVRVRGFKLDWTERNDTAGPTFRVNHQGDHLIEDVPIVGTAPASDTDDDKTPTPNGTTRAWNHKIFNVLVRDGNSHGVVRRCPIDFSAGAFHDGHKGGEGVCILHKGHEGTVWWVDCEWNNVNGDAPVYGSGLGKAVYVNVETINCAMSQFRAGGPHELYGCRGVIDHDNANYSGEFHAANGVLWAGQLGDHHGGLIKDTELVVRSSHTPVRAFRFHDTANDVTGYNVRIQWDVDEERLVHADAIGSGYGNYSPQPPYNLNFERVTIEGSGRAGTVFHIPSRRGSTISGQCSIDHGRFVDGPSDVSVDRDGAGYTPPDSGETTMPTDSTDTTDTTSGTDSTTDSGTTDGSTDTTTDTTDTTSGPSPSVLRFQGHSGGQTWIHVEATEGISAGAWANTNDPAQDPYADRILDATNAVGCMAAGGRDSFELMGDLAALSIRGAGCDVTLDGEPVDASDYPDADPDAFPADLQAGWTQADLDRPWPPEETDGTDSSGTDETTDGTSDGTTDGTSGDGDSTADAGGSTGEEGATAGVEWTDREKQILKAAAKGIEEELAGDVLDQL